LFNNINNKGYSLHYSSAAVSEIGDKLLRFGQQIVAVFGYHSSGGNFSSFSAQILASVDRPFV